MAVAGAFQRLFLEGTMPKTVIKFIKPSGPYTVGDIAGFDTKEQAQPYIDAKLAEAYEAPKGGKTQAKNEGS